MAGTGTTVVRLSDLRDGQEAECFATLVRKVRGITSRNEPFIKCIFRDKRETMEAPLWHDHPFHAQANQWVDGIGYRLRVRAEWKLRYGMQLDILSIRPAGREDEADGYDFFDLVESSEFSVAELTNRLNALIEKYITDPRLKQLVHQILDEHAEMFQKMPAAQNYHHSYTAGLLEHVWSMTRIAGFLASHYASYYSGLNPPLDRGVVVAASILHDIGKLRELAYNPVEAKYTKEGSLIGHVQLGRDMVREAARKIPDFPAETLLLLEHAILAHHGRREFGAPVVPQTIEALIVSYVDDIDAKINIVARERLGSKTPDEFTDKIFALDNRRIYKGIPVELPTEDDGSFEGK
jgi:3'-5' exoribonuclease